MRYRRQLKRLPQNEGTVDELAPKMAKAKYHFDPQKNNSAAKNIATAIANDGFARLPECGHDAARSIIVVRNVERTARPLCYPEGRKESFGLMWRWLDEATRRRLIIVGAVIGGAFLGMLILRWTGWFL